MDGGGCRIDVSARSPRQGGRGSHVLEGGA